MRLARGQKAKLADLTPATDLVVGLGVQAPGSPDFDISCFGVDENGKLSDDRYFVFYNQKQSPEGEIRALGTQGGDQEAFRVNLSHLPSGIRRLVFTVTLDSPGTMSKVSRGHLRLLARGAEVARFPFTGADFGREKAIIAGEIYRKGGWRIAAVGQGFDGGLSALLRHFGGVETEEPAAPAAAPPPTLTPPLSAKVDINKVTLEKQESVSLSKATSITAALEWEGRGDLDLYCFYVTTRNEENKVYYRRLGDTQVYPYIALDGDSRVPGRETITIARPDSLKYALIAAYSAIKNGFGSFKSYKPRAVITDDQGQTVIVPLLEKNWFSYWVAITLIDFTQPLGNVIKHVETYSKFGVERSPLLYQDGTFKMNVGPMEFKWW